MAKTKFDELNILKELRAYRNGNFDSVSMEMLEVFRELGVKSKVAVENDMFEWFGIMQIPQTSIQQRARLACEFEDRFIETLIFLYIEHEADSDVDYESMEQRFFADYGEAIEQFLKDSDAFKREDTIDRKFDFAEEVTETTLNGTGTLPPYSEQRAMLMAREETQSLFSKADYDRILNNGSTYKTWCTCEDELVRPDHVRVDRVTIPVYEYFDMGDCLMLYPHDHVNGTAKQLLGCRCWLE